MITDDLMATILITGGSGLIGRALTRVLLAERHTVRWLSRSNGPEHGVQRFLWEVDRGTVQPGALDGVDHIVHLSGADVAERRWTDKRLRELYASRGGAARLLLRLALAGDIRPKSFVSASGIGYYGMVTRDHFFTENDPPGSDTIAKLTKDWEDAADEWAPLCRVVKLRTPPVLATEGEVLRKLSAPVRLGLGAGLGSGKQWMPWVHLDDLIRLYLRAILIDSIEGAYNVAAEEQPTNRAFMRAVAHVLHKPFFLPNVPAFALKLALGELSAVVLEGSRMSSDRLRSTGFTFRYERLDDALREALGNH